MATALSTTQYTLADWAKNINPDGSIAQVAELLSQYNQIHQDMTYIEGNLPTGHRGSVRTSLPTPTWRRLNQGVDPTKTTEAQVTDTVGMQETYAVVDKALADLNGNTAQWRLSQEKGFMEGMAQDMAAQLFYGNTSLNPEKLMGFTPRYASLSTSTSQTANNTIAAATSPTAASSASIWLIGWGDDKITGIFPKGSKAGLQMDDLGEDAAFDANNKRYQAYITHYVWKAGLHVKDWRYGVRICNIDTTTNAGGLRSSTPPDLVDLVDQAIARIPNLDACKPALYMNRTVRRYFNKQRSYGWPSSSTINTTTINRLNANGQDPSVIKRWDNYDGIPVRIVDQLLNTETTVS